ncbi:MAG: Bug family tripartite tricarboxylate transporter substrate binding protein [Pseudomonadota bacterium]
MRHPVHAVCGLVSLFAAGAAAAQAWPSRPIRLIAPSGAGGPVDVICRAVAQALGDVLGQQVVTDNRVGAAGLIGTEFVVRQPPDGHTLLFGFSGPLSIVPHLNAATPYDPLRDLAPVSQVASAPYVLIVNSALPVRSVKDLVALARKRPGQMHFASGGTGVGIHMAGELFKVTAGVDIVHVPYKGAAPGLTALLAGEVEMMFNGLGPAMPHIKTGRVRALAVGGERRSELLPELPTVRESGFDFNTEGWYGVLGPRELPAAVIETLHRALAKVSTQPEHRAQLARLSAEALATTPAEFSAMLRDEHGKWGRVIKAAGIRM